MDAFSFNESRYVNSHIDYETFIRDNIRIERAFILPNDKLSVYTDAVNREYSILLMTKSTMLKLLSLILVKTNLPFHFM